MTSSNNMSTKEVDEKLKKESHNSFNPLERLIRLDKKNSSFSLIDQGSRFILF